LILPDATSRFVNLLRTIYPDWPRERAEKLARHFTVANLPSVCGSAGEPLPANWEKNGWPHFAPKLVGAARHLGYLTWRYCNHPCFRYRSLAVEDGDRTGLLVWRLETIRRGTAHAPEDADRIGRLVEFLPSSRKNARALFTRFRHELAEAGAFGADYYGYHGETRAWLEEAGFLEVSGHPDGPAIPSRFQPLEPRGGNILSAVFVADDVPACSMDPFCNWYWTKSDSDQDRPN
jgi:hypothetical protein